MSEQLAREQLKKYKDTIQAASNAAWDATRRGMYGDEAMNEPGQLPSIQSAQTDAGQFDLQAPNPGAAQPNEAIYNPFAGQYYIDEQGRKIERNPTNSSLRTGP